MNGIRFFFAVVIICLFVFFAIFMRMQKREPEHVDSDIVLDQANQGNVEAMRSLRKRHLVRKEVELANYWLYKGALHGDLSMAEEYVAAYRALPELQKKREMQAIVNSSATEKQKKELLERLVASGS